MTLAKKTLEEKEVKRGRPKKTEPQLHNEEVETITMSKKKITKQDIEEGVTKVREPYSTTPPSKITMDDISARWKQVFNKYASTGIDSIYGAWGSANGLFLNNPFTQNQRLKQSSTAPGIFSDEEIKKALEDPTQNEQMLRAISMQLYLSNYMYQKVVNLNKDVPLYNWYATPLYLEDGVDKKKLREDGITVDKALKKFNPQLTLKTIATQVAIEGKCSYLVRTSYNRKDVNFLLLQKLNSDNIKITSFDSRQQFGISFNFNIFLRPAYDVSQYPQFFRDTWQQMIDNGIIVEDKRGKKKLNPKAELPAGHILETGIDGQYFYWVKLPTSLCYTFYANGAHPNVVPDFLGLFDDLNSIEKYRWLQASLLSKGVTSLLVGEVPMAKDLKAGADQTALSVDTILGFTDLFNNTVSANIAPFFAPMIDYQMFDIQSQPEALNIVYEKIKDLIASSGLSGLMTVSDKPSIASTKAAEKMQAAQCDYLTRQFESFLNQVINENFDLNYDWNVSLWGNIFTQEDELTKLKEMIIAGSDGLIPRFLSACGQSVEDYKGADSYVKSLGIKMIKEESKENNNTGSSSNSKSKTKVVNPGETIKVGRTPLKDDDIENDSTDTSRNQGGNTSENKKDK